MTFNKKIISLILIFWSTLSIAESVQIFNLYPMDRWVAGLNIPLRISGIDIQPTTGVKIEVIPGTLGSQDCKVMQDPFIPKNFLLRCLKAGTLSLRFTINAASIANPQSSQTILNYGPITVNALAGLKIQDGAPSGSDPSSGNTIIAEGNQLFTTYCTACHTSKSSYLSTGHPSSASSIWSAINGGQPAMSRLQSDLTSDQVDKISAYLKAP